MVSLRHETPVASCAGPGCGEPLSRPATGRPARYCCDACRSRAHRLRQRGSDVPVVAEVDFGSATSRGRLAEQAWMVRLRRGERDVIVAIGLRRHAADRLAEQITDLLTDRLKRQLLTASARETIIVVDRLSRVRGGP